MHIRHTAYENRPIIKYEKDFDTKKIAKLYGITTRAVEKWAAKNNVPRDAEGRKKYLWTKDLYLKFCSRGYKERVLKYKFYSSEFVSKRCDVSLNIVNEWVKHHDMAFVKKVVIEDEQRTGRKGTEYTVSIAYFDIQCPDGTIGQFYEQQSDFDVFRDDDLQKENVIAWDWKDIKEFEKSLSI